ncbi:dihydrolipoamide dehydrogenase [Legionella taurinensis]|uniref:Dihydrolipoamide dehydrogenase n=1 Tax=Legionella taurinensis TaxID=70611 RepID=A0A3A5LGX7_9GAMM|nr:FAD-dependent oxidoreductase [Legionella taurinensis]MDX1837715.1 FAD-dependent oxidoreductase [Legionella taurinensis]PUT39997.1 dihydrolipoamide dehydrogenase [Legionella taurinensis]PUT43763.1 dihydrolipoamide dehydrogenase [Legionella taurinensis]PUT46104.1 dihydrolipoamide dehydrogenase [Legionella taurinensis]PUT47918.1 dihydrolipoamide dehydrogenase [Legionella taurinensis]
MNPLHCDTAIIGAGAAGLSLAAGLSQLGLNVILIEKGLMGGDCLNYGCVPSKALIACAKNFWQARHSQSLGLLHVSSPQEQLDFHQVMRHVHETIDTLAVHDSVARFESLGVNVIQAQARFIDKKTILAGDYAIKAKRIVIATGSSPAIPPIPGLDEVPYLTNETLFKLTELPRHLLVIGGGPIGCELAQAFAMLGSHVSLLESQVILNRDDAECAAIVRQSMENTGVHLYEGVEIHRITHEATGIRIAAQHHQKSLELNGSHLLVAAGRITPVDELGLEAAGIRCDGRHIAVNRMLRTSNRRVFAIGDAAGRLQFTHVANDHAGLVLKQIAFKLPVRLQENAIPWVTYTYPELAHVGLSEQDALQRPDHYRILKLDFKANDRANTDGKTQGLLKVIVTKKGTVSGVSLCTEDAGELIFPWILAVREQRSLRLFTDTIIPYPTRNELSKRLAGQFYAPKLFSPWVKKIVRMLSWF